MKSRTMEIYLSIVEEKISDLLSSKRNKNVSNDILVDIPKTFLRTSLRIKQIQMNIGRIWEILIGNYKDYIDVSRDVMYSFDILNPTLKLAIELKNRHNTDNSSSRTYKYKCLAQFKKT